MTSKTDQETRIALWNQLIQTLSPLGMKSCEDIIPWDLAEIAERFKAQGLAIRQLMERDYSSDQTPEYWEQLIDAFEVLIDRASLWRMSVDGIVKVIMDDPYNHGRPAQIREERRRKCERAGLQYNA